MKWRHFLRVFPQLKLKLKFHLLRRCKEKFLIAASLCFFQVSLCFFQMLPFQDLLLNSSLAEDLFPTPPVQYPYSRFGMIPKVDPNNQGKYPLKFVCSTHGQEWVYAMALSASFVDYIRDNPFSWLLNNNLGFLPVVKRQDPDVIVNSTEWINYVKLLPSAPLALDRYTLPLLFPEQFNVPHPPFADSYLVGQSPLKGRECSIEYTFIHPDLGYPVIATRDKPSGINSFKSLDVTFKGTFVAVPSDAKWSPSLESISALELEVKSQEQEINSLKALVAKQNAQLQKQERWIAFLRRLSRGLGF